MIPVMNPDGLFHGVSRYNSALQDLNREWDTDLDGGPSLTTELIVRAVSGWIRDSFNADRKPVFFLDLHCHGQKKPRYALQSPEEILVPFCEELHRFWPIARVNNNKPHSARWFVDRTHGVPAGTFEISQAHLGDGLYLSVDDFRQHGADIALAIECYSEKKEAQSN